MAKTALAPPPVTRGTDVVPPRSATPEDATNQQPNPDITSVSANTPSQKRGRGRPTRSKSDTNKNLGVSAQPTRKPSGRPKRGGDPAVPTTSVAAAVRSSTRSTKWNPLAATAAPATTTTVDGSRKRGRPSKDNMAAGTVSDSTVGPSKKRGRKPKGEEVAAKSVGRRKKDSSVAPEAANTRELKQKVVLLKKKVKEAADKLKIALAAIDEVGLIVGGM